jgi:hypothetical protein
MHGVIQVLGQIYLILWFDEEIPMNRPYFGFFVKRLIPVQLSLLSLFRHFPSEELFPLKKQLSPSKVNRIDIQAVTFTLLSE